MPHTKHGKPDTDNPDITVEEMGTARPAHKVLPQFFNPDGSLRRRRGTQKAETKQLVSLRLDRTTIATYRATGRGWQSRLNDDLAKVAKRIARRPDSDGGAR